jgi:hypothetical protein
MRFSRFGLAIVLGMIDAAFAFYPRHCRRVGRLRATLALVSEIASAAWDGRRVIWPR